jgi:hypothetical protein
MTAAGAGLSKKPRKEVTRKTPQPRAAAAKSTVRKTANKPSPSSYSCSSAEILTAAELLERGLQEEVSDDDHDNNQDTHLLVASEVTSALPQRRHRLSPRQRQEQEEEEEEEEPTGGQGGGGRPDLYGKSIHSLTHSSFTITPPTIYITLYHTQLVKLIYRDFTWPGIDWNIHYAALEEYGREYGHCNVPFKCVYECTLRGAGEAGGDVSYAGNLGRWLDRQRQNQKGGYMVGERG